DNTLGRRIRDREERVKIFGKEYELKAQVEELDSFSGHADHSELLDYFKAMTGPRQKVWLVHGEEARSEALAKALRAEHEGDIEIARLGDTVKF
ncbi:MAG: MBL fold metallo-hydrolase RNA specificity domain-containing protein, partial [Verrucomicrobiales bacterium]